MSVPIEKSGHASCSAPADWFSFEAGVFQNVGASSFCIHNSLQKLIDVYPHHVSVAHSAHFSASHHCYSSTSLLNFLRNSSTTDNPSYVDSSLASVVTQNNDLIIML